MGPATSSAATGRAASCAGDRSTRCEGDVANHAWGVIDVLAVTDFPDIRLKATIQSTSGSIVLIPREGGYMARFYVDLGEVTDENRARLRAMSSERCDGGRRARARAVHRRGQAGGVVLDLRGRVSGLTDTFDDANRSRGHAEGVHRGRRLPHPQRQGGAGHERLDAGRLQPRLEARRGSPGPQRSGAARHLFRRAPGRRARADRLRP